jgi:hypothetical protein
VIVSGESERRVTYVRANACVWQTPAVYPHTIGDARQWAREQLVSQHVPEEAVIDAVLVVSELLTSVLREAPGEAELTLLVEDDLLTITCADRDTAEIRSGTLDRTSAFGRTLALVDLLSRACFIRKRTGGGKRVIALLALAAPES